MPGSDCGTETNRLRVVFHDPPDPVERPTEVLFDHAGPVRDATPFLPSGHHDGHGNFVVDRSASFAAFYRAGATAFGGSVDGRVP